MPQIKGGILRNQNQRFYCRLCHKSNLPKKEFTSHNIGDKQCTQLSTQDRKKLATIGIVPEGSDSNEEEEISNLLKEFGYLYTNGGCVRVYVRACVPNFFSGF